MSYLTAAMVGAGIGLIAVWIAANIRHFLFRSQTTVSHRPSDIERQFINVFAIMTPERRQVLVGFDMRPRFCHALRNLRSRTGYQAMELSAKRFSPRKKG